MAAAKAHSGSVIGEFFVALGLDVNESQLAAFETRIKHLTHSVEGMAAAFGLELAKRAYEFVESSVGAAAKVQDLSEVVDLGADTIAAMGRVAVDASSDMASMQSAIMSVSQATGQAALGVGRNVKLFQKLGISAKDAEGNVKGVDEVMAELAGKFAGKSTAERNMLAQRFGIDPYIAKKMAEAGAEGWRDEIEKAKGRGFFSKDDYKRAEETEKTLKKFNSMIRGISALIGIQLAPYVTQVTDAISKFISKNKLELTAKIKGAFEGISKVFTLIWRISSALWPILEKTAKFLMNNVVASTALKVALAAIVAMKITEGFNKMAAAVQGLWTAFQKLPSTVSVLAALAVLVALLIEDYMVWKEGGDSLIGTSETLQTVVLGTIELIKMLGDSFKGLGTIGTALGDVMFNTFQWVGDKIGWVIDKIKGAIDLIKDLSGYTLFKSLVMDEKVIGQGSQLGDQNAADVKRFENQQKAQMLQGLMVGRDNSSYATWLRDHEGVVPAQGQVSNTSITGTTINIKADTPERARMAGKSVREELSPQRIRNNQAKER